MNEKILCLKIIADNIEKGIPFSESMKITSNQQTSVRTEIFGRI